MILIVGLGNPGKTYKNTRHNVGFKVINLWAESLGILMGGNRFQSNYGQTKCLDKEIILLCPQTFMNHSGIAVQTCAHYYRIEPEDIVVIHDDLDLAAGRIKIVRNGGAGGHKGVLSIIGSLGTDGFRRIRIGIGRPRFGETNEDYVLSPFYKDERDTMEKALQTAVQACSQLVSQGIDRAMNEFN